MATLLVSTVGGTPDPVIATCLRLKPAKVIFVPSLQTRCVVEAIQAELKAQGLLLAPAQYEVRPVSNGEDFQACVRHFRALYPGVREWVERGVGFEVAIDFTGGTKCMSAALAGVAQRWPCRFFYVGGHERTKDGVGVVVKGREKVVESANPWDALGYQVCEDAALLFNRHAFAAAGHLLGSALQRAALSPDARRTVATLQALIEGYGAWDRFQRADAYRRLGDVERNANDLRQLLGTPSADALIDQVRVHRQLLERLKTGQPSPELVADLIANARRRGDEGRYDDGVARLYRAVEALAQERLAVEFQIETGRVEPEQVPEHLRRQWWPGTATGPRKVGLQEAYRLLDALGHDLGRRFLEGGLGDSQRSPLQQRNASILAHGFSPVGPNVFEELWQATLALAGLRVEELTRFPTLGLASGGE